MRIRIETALTPVGKTLEARLTEAGHTVTLLLAATRSFEIAYERHLPIDDVTGLLATMTPLSPAIMPVSSVEDADVLIRIGHDRPLSKWDITLHVDDAEFGKRVRTQLEDLGFRISDTEVEDIDDIQLRYGSASNLARQLLRVTLADCGVTDLEERKSWSDSDDDIWIYLQNPELVGKPLNERCAVVLASDDLGAALTLQSTLQSQGFSRVQLRPLDASLRPIFSLNPGPFGKDALICEKLTNAVATFLNGAGADPHRYPMKVNEDADGGEGGALITLPLKRLADEALRPWAGSDHDRWDVQIMTDSVTRATSLTAPLAELGIEFVRIQAGADALIDPVVRCPMAAEETAAIVRDFLLDQDLGLEEVRLDTSLPSDSNDVVVELPLVSAGDRDARLKRAAGKWDLTLKAPDPTKVTALEHRLRTLPWSSMSVETESDSSARIQHGGAPRAIVELVQRWVTEATGHTLKIEKSWSDSDDDIWVSLPAVHAGLSGDDALGDDELDLNAWLRMVGDAPVETTASQLVELTRDRLRVGPISLSRRGALKDDERALVPLASHFTHYCLDTTTAASLVHVAESVLLSEPCLLEGETSVSKTSVVLYLAMLLGQPVVRLNLNGQTDTGELVGRFVPRDELPEDGQPAHPWRWQDGLVVTAMKRGWWVVLDELNLAEPQILERLNPALERIPSLVLTEHRGEVIGAGGQVVAPTFRMFATMNPAEYAGRSALSPAYRDRWRGYRFVKAPGEAEYLDMLRFLTHGNQPTVEVLGEQFVGAKVDAPVPALADVPGLDNFLRALARFHAGLEGAARSQTGSLGSRRKDRYVFTRRGLLAVIDYLAARGASSNEATLRKALIRYYLGRVRPGSDRAMVARLMDAAGIGPTTWAPDKVDDLDAQLAELAGGLDESDDDE
ncbi:MAG: AAA family ATPase [Myxococcales bacterium]|nr:AAA family ATPase [Myxococcales bacterium]